MNRPVNDGAGGPASLTTDQLNTLRTHLHNYGLGNWCGKSTTTEGQQLLVAQACADALDQFDRYEAQICERGQDDGKLEREIVRLQEFIASEFFQRVTYKQESDTLRRRAFEAKLEKDSAVHVIAGLSDRLIASEREVAYLRKTCADFGIVPAKLPPDAPG